LPRKAVMEKDKLDRKKRLKKLLRFLKSLKGEKPDYDNLDFSKYHQTEEDYQKEQNKWLEKVRKKKDA